MSVAFPPRLNAKLDGWRSLAQESRTSDHLATFTQFVPAPQRPRHSSNSFLPTFRKHLWFLLLAGQLAAILNIIVCDHGGDLSCCPRRIVGYAPCSRISYCIR